MRESLADQLKVLVENNHLESAPAKPTKARTKNKARKKSSQQKPVVPVQVLIDPVAIRVKAQKISLTTGSSVDLGK